MAKNVKLTARPRKEIGRNAVKAVRARDAVPAVIYGAQGAPMNLEVERRAIENVLAHAVGENILIDLEIQDGNTTSNRLSLIQEVQHHPIKGSVLHVDFHAVSMTEEIETEVVLEPVGEAIGAKTFGGLLQQSMRTLAIRCLPQNLPELLTVDVSSLNVGQSLHVRDLQLPAGVQAVADPELTVFLVSEPTVSESSTTSETPQAPEVIKEKKTEDAGSAEEKK